MMSNFDREQTLERLLAESEGKITALISHAAWLEQHDPQLSEDARLITELRQLQPARAEVSAARARVGQRLAQALLSDNADPRPLRPVYPSEPPFFPVDPTSSTPVSPENPAERRPHSVWWRGARRVATLAAALVLLAIGLGFGASTASAQALPESPLYAVKRADESVMLAFSWTDQAHAQTLGMIATRRLSEAAAEADQNRMTEAKSLVGEFNADMGQLIELAAQMSSRGEDATSAVNQIDQALAQEQNMERDAMSKGQSAFAAALSASSTDVTSQLEMRHVATPAHPTGGHSENPGKGHSNNGKGAPTSTPSPTGQPGITPSVTVTPGSGSSHGAGNGNGDNSGAGANSSSSSATSHLGK